MKKIRWAVNMYCDWMDYRNNSPTLMNVECDLNNVATITKASLSSALCKFITEVKKLDGSDYPGKTLYDIIISLQFHLELCGINWKLLNDEELTQVRFTLDNMMKLRTSQGVGNRVRKAEVLTEFDEEILWSMGLLGTWSPVVLLNTVIFLIGKGCALRAGKEHRLLRSPPFKSQFEFFTDNEGNPYIRYTEDLGLKTNKGGLKHRKIDPKIVHMYSIPNKDRCPVTIISKYLSLLPNERKCTAFYLQPLQKFKTTFWF